MSINHYQFMKATALALLTLTLLNTVSAALLTQTEFNISVPQKSLNDSDWDRITIFLDQFNDYSKSMPDMIKSIIGNEVIRVELTLEDGSKKLIGVKTENGLITSYSQEPYNDSTLALYLSERGVMELITSKDPINALRSAWGKDIRYEGLNFFNSFRMFFVDIGFRIYSFFTGLSFAPKPLSRAPRSEGLTINLMDWWADLSPGTEIDIDPLGGAAYLYWLDEEGNICHGEPGVNGQPGPAIIMPSRFAELRTNSDEERMISIEELIRLRNDTYSLGGYTATGGHILHYRNSIWREKSYGIVFEDLRAVQSSYLTDIYLSDYITPGYVQPKAMLRLNGYNCSLTEYLILPAPSPSIPGETEAQHPTKCLTKSSVTGPMIVQACREGRLEGGLSEGYLRIT